MGDKADDEVELSSFSLPVASSGDAFSAIIDDYASVPTYPDRPHFHHHHITLQPSTQLICFDGCPDDPFRPSSMPIYQTSTFIQPSASEFGSYDYSRSGNPTRTALETFVAGLENAYSAFAFSSGMAALSAVTRIVKNGEHIIASADLYGGMHRLLTRVSTTNGAVVHFVDTSNVEQLRSKVEELGDKLRLVHVETPSNPLMRITDLRATADAVHSVGALLSVDSTMMSPFLQKPLALGADLVIHSATKFLSGHADIIAGIVCTKTKELADQIAFLQNAEGTALGPFDCWLLMRSMKTLALRVERAQENAAKVAAFLSRHPAVSRLHFSGPIPNPKKQDPVPWGPNAFNIGMREDDEKKVNISSSHAAHKLHMTQATGGGSVLSFETGNVEFSRRIVDACRIFKITVSFGSCNSLIEMPCTLSHASIPTEKRTLPADLIRISIGIEDSKDILEDLERAFRCAASGVEDVRSIRLLHRDLMKIAITDISAAEI